MKRMRKMIAVMFLITGLLLAGCGENVAPDLANVQVKMKATTSLGNFDASGRISDNHITFNEALLGVTKVEFESMEGEDYDDDSDSSGDDDHSGSNHSGDDDEDDSMDDDSDENDDSDDNDDYDDAYEIEYEGNFIVDLIAGTSTPDLGITNGLPGTYKELEVELEPILEGGYSVFIVLTYQPEGSDPIVVEFSTNRAIEIEIEREKGFTIEAGMLNQVLVMLDLDKLLEGLNLSEAQVDEDGIIRINRNSNPDLESFIWNKLRMAIDAGDDDDRDDEFDDEDED